MSNFQRESRSKASTSTHGLKRKRSYDTDPMESSESAPSPSASEHIPIIDFKEEIDVKYEYMDYDSNEAGPAESDIHSGLDEVEVEEIKAEPEDDPLVLSESPNEFETNGATTQETIRCCDEGYLPASGQNLPLIDAVAVMEFLTSFRDYDNEQVRVLWRQNSQLTDDSIGYVQLKREGSTCTVKCQVATKTTINNCSIYYNEPCTTVQAAVCDCAITICSHAMTALIWLSKPKGPITYWMLPMVCRDPSTMRVSSIFGLPKSQSIPTPSKSFLKEFVYKCEEKGIFSPLVMKYHKDERPLASLHKLMEKFKLKFTCLEDEAFLGFYRTNITKNHIASLNVPLSPQVIQDLEYGRISDAILLDACVASTDDEISEVVDKIMNPQLKDTVILKQGIRTTLQASLKESIKRCSMYLSDTSPIFSASPYGTTSELVIFIKNSDQQDSSESDNKMSPKDRACMQLQMGLTKKKTACYCKVLSNNKVAVSILNYDEKWLLRLLRKSTKFWQAHIFKRIVENSE